VKICTGCHTSKELSEFNKKSSSKDGHRARCKLCQREDGKEYYSKNVETLKIKHRAYYLANPERIKVWSDNWNKKNPEKSKARYLKYRHGNLEKCRARDEDYRLRNMGRDAAKTARRRAAKKQRTPPWLTAAHFKQIQAFYTYAKELEVETGVNHHVDHIFPLNGETSSGLHVPWNLQVLTAEDNLKKSNKIVDVLSAQALGTKDALALAERVNKEMVK